MNYGNKVIIRLGVKYKNTIEKLRNVTEIHYCYESAMKEPRIAFESDIQETGITYRVSDVIEFETMLETKKEKEF